MQTTTATARSVTRGGEIYTRANKSLAVERGRSDSSVSVINTNELHEWDEGARVRRFRRWLGSELKSMGRVRVRSIYPFTFTRLCSHTIFYPGVLIFRAFPTWEEKKINFLIKINLHVVASCCVLNTNRDSVVNPWAADGKIA